MAETTLPEGANVDQEDALAEILGGVEEDVNEGNEEDSNDDADDLNEDSDESTDEDSDEEQEQEQEQAEDDDDDQTWDGVLGVDDGSISLNEDGDFTGVNVKIDGVASTINMKDLIAGYQTNKHNTNSSQALANERRQFDAVKGNAISDYTKKLDNVAKLSEYMHNNLLKEYQGVDWQRLRADDPAEYAAAYQDFERRKGEIQDIYSAIEAERGNESQANASQTQADQQQYLTGELQKVLANNPEWDTPEKVQGAFKDMGDFVNETYGITPEVFNALGDSRYVEVMKDAMAYRKGKKVTQKKVKQNLPKFQKSKNGKAAKRVSKLDKLTKAAKRASGPNRRELESNAIAELLGG